MKAILLAVLCLGVSVMPEWMTDFNKAREIATENKQLILLNFSGSDWCAPCIRLKKEVFSSPEFNSVSGEVRLVLVNADFPRNRKNQLSREQQTRNDQLADRYNPQGKFPYTVLLDSEGKVIQAWDGFPENGKENFIIELEQRCRSKQP